MTWERFEKPAPEQYRYKGLCVGRFGITISSEAMSAVREICGRRLAASYDKEANAIKLRPAEANEQGYSTSGQIGIRLAKVMPTGRYLFKEALPDGVIFTQP